MPGSIAGSGLPLARTTTSVQARQPSGLLFTATIAGRVTSVGMKRRRKKGSTRKTSGPFEKRCGAWRMSGLNATG